MLALFVSFFKCKFVNKDFVGVCPCTSWAGTGASLVGIIDISEANTVCISGSYYWLSKGKQINALAFEH